MSWHGWSLGAPLLYVLAAGTLYALGGARRRGRARDPEPLRNASFLAGLATIVLALDSPLDGGADQLFWVHMLQHVLLLTVAPPLILLGRPWPRMWRALPLRARTRLGRTLARAPGAAPLRAVARPLPAWLLFNGTLLAWHVPAAYDATLADPVIHQLEHGSFFFTGLLLWAWVVDSGPLRPRLSWPGRVVYVLGTMTVSWVLAVGLVLLPHPLYAHYAELASRPGGISAMADQSLAGGVMWVLGSLGYSVSIFVALYRWLEPPGQMTSAASGLPV